MATLCQQFQRIRFVWIVIADDRFGVHECFEFAVPFHVCDGLLAIFGDIQFREVADGLAHFVAVLQFGKYSIVQRLDALSFVAQDLKY